MADNPVHFTGPLTDAVRICLENMAFMSVEPPSRPEDCRSGQEGYSAVLLVHDPIQAEMQMSMPAAVLGEVAASIYASDAEELTETQRHDILAELLNTIAGLFLAELLPCEQAFRMGLPEVHKGDDHASEPQQGHWFFKTDHGCFCITLSGPGWDALAG